MAELGCNEGEGGKSEKDRQNQEHCLLVAVWRPLPLDGSWVLQKSLRLRGGGGLTTTLAAPFGGSTES